MSIANNRNFFPKESSELINKITQIGVVRSAHIESYNSINSKNYENRIYFNKEILGYIMNINFKGHHYKVLASIDGNKPNPKFEKQIKKLF